MSEIRDRVEKDWAKVMSNIPTMRKSVDIGSLIEVLLAHQDVAIVDRKAELPSKYTAEGNLKYGGMMAQDMLKDGWVKEDK